MYTIARGKQLNRVCQSIRRVSSSKVASSLLAAAATAARVIRDGSWPSRFANTASLKMDGSAWFGGNSKRLLSLYSEQMAIGPHIPS